jgi:hypothetical protein
MRVDRDSSGQIDFCEFCEMMTLIHRASGNVVEHIVAQAQQMVRRASRKPQQLSKKRLGSSVRVVPFEPAALAAITGRSSQLLNVTSPTIGGVSLPTEPPAQQGGQGGSEVRTVPPPLARNPSSVLRKKKRNLKKALSSQAHITAHYSRLRLSVDKASMEEVEEDPGEVCKHTTIYIHTWLASLY